MMIMIMIGLTHLGPAGIWSWFSVESITLPSRFDIVMRDVLTFEQTCFLGENRVDFIGR
jgi:hypothetical protein